jgi:hypothetical protein
MFTIDDFIFGGITHTALHEARMKKLRDDNLILNKNIFKIVGTDNAAFYIDSNIEKISRSINDYDIQDIRPSDIVLDIGANIGGFCLNICKKVHSVYAIEPLFIDTLNRNIQLNNAKNINVIPCALGSGEINITYNGLSRKVIGLSLGDIAKLCGDNIDFLKCDCEGAEWCMTLSEIMNIRRIEAEIHNFDGRHNFKDFENLLISSGFDYTSKIRDGKTMLISAKNRYID